MEKEFSLSDYSKVVFVKEKLHKEQKTTNIITSILWSIFFTASIAGATGLIAIDLHDEKMYDLSVRYRHNQYNQNSIARDKIEKLYVDKNFDEIKFIVYKLKHSSSVITEVAAYGVAIDLYKYESENPIMGKEKLKEIFDIAVEESDDVLKTRKDEILLAHKSVCSPLSLFCELSEKRFSRTNDNIFIAELFVNNMWLRNTYLNKAKEYYEMPIKDRKVSFRKYSFNRED